jgi:precorrin-4 methylase
LEKIKTMKKLVYSALIVCGFMVIHVSASAQTTKKETTTPEVEQSATTTENADGTEVAEPDSTAAETGTPATSTDNEKPAIRHRLYSGRQRGNNVIYDPKN